MTYSWRPTIALLVVSLFAFVGCAMSNAETPESLANALGLSDSDRDLASAIVLLSLEETEAAIQSCMQEDGFNYQPPVVHRDSPGFPGDPDGLLSGDEYAAAYGFGLVEMLSPSEAQARPEQQNNGNPNAAALSEMSTAEGEQWRRSLDLCRRVGEEAGFAVYEELSELGEFMATIPERVAADQRAIAAQRTWTECMSREGFQYNDQEAMMADLESTAAELMSQADADFSELRTAEIGAAVAFQACRGPLEETKRVVRLELELEALEDPRIRSSVKSFSERD